MYPVGPVSVAQLRAGQYSSMQEWRDDVQLIFDNARKYNGDAHPVSQQALKLQAALERRMDDAKEMAERNLQAAVRGEPRPRKSVKPRTNAEVLATDSSLPASSDSEDAPPVSAAVLQVMCLQAVTGVHHPVSHAVRISFTAVA